MTQSLRLGSLAVLFTLSLLPATIHAQAFLPPTPEELALTSIPEVPGARAVILYKEETTDDLLRAYSYYYRIKILTEGGKDEANVKLPFGGGAGITLESISARTIHPDGTIIPFTGKPYEKLIVKTENYKIKEKIFTLPDVTVGSIIEYRYKFHYDESVFMQPEWIVQSDLFIRKAHFVWNTTHSGAQQIEDSHGNPLNSVAWTPILPPGDKVVRTSPGGRNVLTLDIADVKPLSQEDFMPPINSVSYRVLFYYTSYRSSAEFWSKEGKTWSKEHDKFIGPGKAVKETVNTLVAPSDTSDAKLRKIYNAVQALENTDFTRERSIREDKTPQSTDDILNRKRGSSDQLADLFVAMARAAGLKAYLMGVADRSQRLFLSSYLSLDQLDDNIAIVDIDGKDQFLDPGQRYCPYGQLAWKHTLSGGLRQTDGGNAEIAATPGSAFKESAINRTADLILDEQGIATGVINIAYTGSPALRWRQEALRGDTTSLNSDLKENVQHMLPAGLDVSVADVQNLTSPDLPLKIRYEIKGSVGSSTGKRLLVPANLFEANSKPHFPQATRELTVDMRYPSATYDAVRYKYPANIAIESAVADDKAKLTDVAVFEVKSVKTANAITLYRNLIIGKTYFTPAEYPDLRTFYGKLEAKDQETLVLAHATEATKSGTTN